MTKISRAKLKTLPLQQLQQSGQDRLELLSSLLYSLGQLTLGLLLHPYRSMQLLVRGKVFLPLAFLPSLFFALMLVLTRVEILVDFLGRMAALKYLYQFLVFFCFYWQLILLYLLYRFVRVFWPERLG